MRLQVPILKTFEFGRPQLYAGLMLLGLAVAGLTAAYMKPISWDSSDELSKVLWGARTGPMPMSASLPTPPHEGIFMYRVVRPLLPGDPYPIGAGVTGPSLKSFFFLIRMPFVIFGLWMGGALWWVSRRLYNNAGGYVALALYCSSPFIVQASSTVNADILAAWGLFGIVYTAIGVAHTLYAPPRKWRPRVVLLGVALGLTAGAHLAAAVVGLILAAFFLLYLAPGRRIASVAILLVSSTIGLAVVWALYASNLGFSKFLFDNTLRLQLFHWPGVPQLAHLPLVMLMTLALATFLAWRRTRYFGNWSALLAAVVLLLLRPAQGNSAVWALPFVFVFIGGMFADLLETPRRALVRSAVVTLITVQALAAIWVVVATSHLSG